MELGFILLKTLPKAISMYMELEEVLGVQFTKTDLVTFATGKRSLVLIFLIRIQLELISYLKFWGSKTLSWTVLQIQARSVSGCFCLSLVIIIAYIY